MAGDAASFESSSERIIGVVLAQVEESVRLLMMSLFMVWLLELFVGEGSEVPAPRLLPLLSWAFQLQRERR